jgi:hypothetical protein
MGVLRTLRRYGCGAALCAHLAACASTRLVLEKPIADKCMTFGLEGCPDLTEGALLYIDGQEAEARVKIDSAVRANEPAKLKEFASSLETLSRLPGADSFMGPVMKLAAILSGPDEKPKAVPAATPPRASHPELAASDVEFAPTKEPARPKPIPVDLSDDDGLGAMPNKAAADILSGTIVPALENGALACQIDSLLPGAAPIPALCLNATTGPLLISDLHVSGACASDLFVLDGTPGVTRWILEAPAHSALHITGARLPSRPGDVVVVAVAASAKVRPDLKCAVTWSGAKP